MEDVKKLENTLNGLLIERNVLDKLRTWPWEPETARAVVTATLLPWSCGSYNGYWTV